MNAIARLHNFVIDERLKENEVIESNEIYNSRPTTTHHRQTGAPVDDNDFENEDANNLFTLAGYSVIRLEMVDRIQEMGLRRPSTSRHFKI